MDYPKISVVTPSFNQAGYLETTMKSVLDQGYPNLEYIVMDGGSTDGSREVLERYSDRLAYWVSEPDGGQTEALARGFGLATGGIMGWLCSDDLLEPGSLFEVAQTFVDNPDWQVVYGDARWIDAEGRPIRWQKEIDFDRFLFMYTYNYLPQPSTFWRSGLYERVGGLDPAFDLAMDADLWARFAEHAGIHHVPRPWSQMRRYPEQKNSKMRAESNVEDDRIRARYLPDESPLTRRSKRALARGLRAARRLRRGAYW